MRVLVAPQEFKGSLTAAEAAHAIAAGLQDPGSDLEVDVLPLSDGGPGFVDAMHAAVGGAIETTEVSGPRRRPVRAEWLLAPGNVAYIEAAQANGLYRLPRGELAPLTATTFGVGTLLLSAAESGPTRIVVGVGGSATTDCGAGMAAALGAKLLRRDGKAVGDGGAALQELSRIEWEVPHIFQGIPITVATDVTNPLLGPNGAAAVFGPQKGATPEDVVVLERGLIRFAEAVERDLGVDLREFPGGGAAGGLAAGLVAFLGANMRSGFDVVAEASGFVERLAAADVVVTGEGSFDFQSRQGKTTGRVIEAAESAGKRWMVVAGVADAPGDNVMTIAGAALPGEDPMEDAAAILRRLAGEAASQVVAGST